MPEAVPTMVHSTGPPPSSSRARAIASIGEMWPAVPPPASTTRRGPEG